MDGEPPPVGRRVLDRCGYGGQILGATFDYTHRLLDFALAAERNDGLGSRDAIFQACLLRFRPIMMTTFAALFGAMPIAFGQGAGSELRQPLGIAIVGGLAVSQWLTLYTTPVIYLFFERLGERLGMGSSHPALATETP